MTISYETLNVFINVKSSINTIDEFIIFNFFECFSIMLS